jgi:hypothetical protein
MTAQIHDTFQLHEKNFSIVGVNGQALFDPQLIGVRTVPSITSCWRGFVCHYKIHDEHLVLNKLQMSLGHEKGPVINGVSPSASDGDYRAFNNVYEQLGLKINFTGGILIADGFIQKLYVHMGFHPAWKYETVFELMFENGRILEIRDASDQMKQIREKTASQPLKPDFLEASEKEKEAWIKNTFKLDYDPED